MEPKLGARYDFIPAAFVGERGGHLPGGKEIPRLVGGTITYINWVHRFFKVDYEVHGYKLSESFKF